MAGDCPECLGLGSRWGQQGDYFTNTTRNVRSTYLGAKYRRIAARRGPVKAIVAVQHAILTAIWNMGTNGTLDDDPGADFYTRLHPDKAKHRAIEQLRRMGYQVTLEPAG